MARLLLGLIKGALVGGALGFGAFELGLGSGLGWVLYGLIGLMVGLLCGRPLWSHMRDASGTTWTAILKGLFGCGVGVGLYALARRFGGGLELTVLDTTAAAVDFQFLLGAAIGGLYGAFVEVDDAPAAGGGRAAGKQR